MVSVVPLPLRRNLHLMLCCLSRVANSVWERYFRVHAFSYDLLVTVVSTTICPEDISMMESDFVCVAQQRYEVSICWILVTSSAP